MIPRVRSLALLALPLIACCLGACSSARAPRAAPFIAPTSAPVVAAIDRAKERAGAARVAARETRVAIVEAKAIAQRILPLAPQAKPELDALSKKLLEAEARAGEAEQRAAAAAAQAEYAKAETARFQTAVEVQTKALNSASAARVAAEEQRDRLQAKIRAVRSQRNWLLAVVVAAALFLFRRPIGALFGLPIP